MQGLVVGCKPLNLNIYASHLPGFNLCESRLLSHTDSEHFLFHKTTVNDKSSNEARNY